ncbi:MAG TPA: hypothetical protein VHG69_03585 [Thermoleophilaceae bacterium]|nr:hypothetical protein [Thermoleophilaceae bacterium]
MATHDVTTRPTPAATGGFARNARRLATETKSFFKTSEWWTYLAMVIAILIAGNAIEAEEGGADFFAADKVWLYITILTVGYLVSRGIAKSGVRDPYWDQPDTGGDAGGLGDRVKAAADALQGQDTHNTR